MKFISNCFNSIKNTINLINPKQALSILKIAGFMLVGTFLGILIHGPLGGGFGLILGYVLGRLILIK
jgi:hypothetical protein